MELTHLNAAGEVHMVDVGQKPVTRRRAVARGAVQMAPATLELIAAGSVPKGDVLAAARLAGIMAAKETPRLIPLCHPLNLGGVEVRLRLNKGAGRVEIEAEVTLAGQTGAEMEALTAVSVAALTIYDMCKGVDRGMSIEHIRLVAKSGGKSGSYLREGEEEWPQGEE